MLKVTEKKVIDDDGKRICCVLSLPDGNTLIYYYGNNNGIIKISNPDEKCIKTWATGPAKCSDILPLDPDHIVISYSNAYMPIHIYNIKKEKPECVKVLPGHDGITTCLCKVDAHTIISGGNDSTIKVWDIEIGTLKNQYKFNSTVPFTFSVQLSPNGNVITTGHMDAINIWTWDNNKMELIKSIPGNFTDFMINNDTLIGIKARTDAINTIKMFDLKKEGTLYKQFQGHPEHSSLTLLRSGHLITYNNSYNNYHRDDDKDNCIKVWDLKKSTCICTLQLPNSTEPVFLAKVKEDNNSQIFRCFHQTDMFTIKWLPPILFSKFFKENKDNGTSEVLEKFKAFTDVKFSLT